MNVHASPFSMNFYRDASLGSILDAMKPHADKALVIHYGGRSIRPGYHITEVKAGSFVTLDCGGNPDEWRETILQVEDPGPEGEDEFMPVGKFRAILSQVAERIAIDLDARMTFEVGPPESPMQVFDVDTLHLESGRIVLQLAPRSAVCKPRHREALKVAQGCCDPAAQKSSCCG